MQLLQVHRPGSQQPLPITCYLFNEAQLTSFTFSTFSLTKLSGDPSSSDEEPLSHLVVPPVKYSKSVTPRPNDVICHTTDGLGTKG